MKKPYTSFVTGLLVGVALFSGTTAYAAGIMAERSTNRIFVDGKEVQVEAYTIHNNNFMQLRDVGKAVGFNVYWDSDNGCVQVESGKPYTGTAPQQTAAAPTDGSRYVPKVGDVIRCDDGTNYTITRTRSVSKGRSGSSSVNYQQTGRELMTPDEVQALDNDHCILFIRGELPVMDRKYDILKHPGLKLTEDGGAAPYIHRPGLTYALEDLPLSTDSWESIEIIE